MQGRRRFDRLKAPSVLAVKPAEPVEGLVGGPFSQ
jgi:hypothetical protein